jgi:glycine cleavage system aminomethyltransferase T
VSFDFLAVDGATQSKRFTPVARSPMERRARAAGAQFELRDGWNVAVAYRSAEQDAETLRRTGGWADVSHLGKLELQAPRQELEALVARSADGATLALGRATRAAGAWWCPLTGSRALVICEPALLPALREQIAEAAQTVAPSANVVEVTTVFAALTIAGPVAREVFARFSALDLRPKITRVGALRPGSIARQPATLICEAPDRFLFLFGWAIGEYMWSVVSDAGEHLGASAIGVDALEPLAPVQDREQAPVEDREQAPVRDREQAASGHA